MTKGLLFVLSGPSGVGKDTVLREFLQERPDCVLSISATTRAPREGEEDGKNYYFLPREHFQQLIEAGEMLEWAEYSGNLYGTPAGPVEELRSAGKNVILEIEVQGALQIKEQCPDAVFVFMMPPSLQTLEDRLRGRGTETDDCVRARMDAARYEISKAGEYDYIIINHSVQTSCEQLNAVITAAPHSIKQMAQYLSKELDQTNA